MNAPVIVWQPADLPAMVALAATFPAVTLGLAPVVDLAAERMARR